MKQFETQIKEDWRWMSYSNKTDLSFSTSELLPGMMYKVRVRAHFSKSYTGFSEVISVKTYDEGMSTVSYFILRVVRNYCLKQRPILQNRLMNEYIVLLDSFLNARTFHLLGFLAEDFRCHVHHFNA